MFEVIVSTLETKLQRIENLDKAVEHLMRRLEALDSRVNDNIDKTDSIISKLRTIDVRLFHQQGKNLGKDSGQGERSSDKPKGDGESLDMRLVSLDQKVSDIDTKLVGLKNQIDSNFLPVDDINAEASEKKPISMNVLEITKAMNAEIMNHITKELDQLRTATGNVDKKLQFHINLVSENLGKVLNMVSDIHTSVVETNKLDTLIKRVIPIVNVSEKMDQVWSVVVGNKGPLDDLLISQIKPERLISQSPKEQIHEDSRSKGQHNQIDNKTKKQDIIGVEVLKSESEAIRTEEPET